MKRAIILMSIILAVMAVSNTGYAQRTNVDILRQGLLGAGTGAIASSVSGGDTGKIWLGALTGAGVNIIGGSLLDVMTNTNDTGYTYGNTRTYTPQRQVFYAKNRKKKVPVYERKWYYEEDAAPQGQGYSEDYAEGYRDGYRDAYIKAYREAVRDIKESN